jgi:hypothetical protein
MVALTSCRQFLKVTKAGFFYCRFRRNEGKNTSLDNEIKQISL